MLVSPTAKGLQKLLLECETFSKDHSIEFSSKKSKMMAISSSTYNDFVFPQIYLNCTILEKVSHFKYLGHIITDDTKDDSDLMRHCRYLYAVGNSLIRKFWFCTVPVKLKLFKIYCGNIYSGHVK